MSISCAVSASTPANWQLHAFVATSYAAASGLLSLRAFNPVFDVLNLLPGACPAQGDAFDGLSDNYFTPGFSFATGFGPPRWFLSTQVAIPVGLLHRASLITIPLADTRSGTPPRNCAVPDPSWQRCSASGAWSGTLTLTATR